MVKLTGSSTQRELQLKVTVSSRATQFSLSEMFKYPVQWALKVSPQDKNIMLNRYIAQKTITVPVSTRPDVEADESIRTHFRSTYNDISNTLTLDFKVPDSAKNPVSGRVTIVDPQYNYKDFIDYSFDEDHQVAEGGNADYYILVVIISI